MGKLFIENFLLPLTENSFTSNQFASILHNFLATKNALTVFRLHSLNHVTNFPSYIKVMAVDFLKAFDKVSHTHLIKVAEDLFQLPRCVTTWLPSYLHNRYQLVYISQNQQTNWKHCYSGVPQGSILGPILFALNSYTAISPRTKVILYADDLTIIHHVPISESDHSQTELDNLSSWACINKMFLNEKKSYLMNINPQSF